MDIRDPNQQLYAVTGSTVTFGAEPAAPRNPIADLYRAKAQEAWDRHHRGERRPGASALGTYADLARQMERKAEELERAAATDDGEVVPC